MNERPGEHEPGYPPAPAPRVDPYSVDETPTGGQEREEWAPHTPDGGDTSDADDRPAAPWPWPGRGEDARAGDDTRQLPRTEAGRGTEPRHATLPWSSPTRPEEPRPWRAEQTSPYAPPAEATAPGGASASPYAPSAAPAEATTPGGAAASPAAEAYAWRDPAPWQRPAGYAPPQPQHPGGRRRQGRRLGVGVVVLLVLVALLGGIILGALGARALWPAASSALPQSGSPTTTARAPESVAGIASAALESTVFIEVISGTTGSSGSGMVLREDGYVVTNNHVIAPAADGGGRVLVTLADGTQEEAEIVGRTSDYDLAVLKVDQEGLTPMALADSDAIVVGDPVVAVGAPLGLEGTVTSGIVSALNRPVQAGSSADASFINAIQTDAAINPGNSGGPLINTAGEVVGINTAIAQAGGRQTGSIGLGFAIPANQVRRTAEQIIETGQATYPVIGVALDTRYQGEGVLVLEEDSGETPAVTPGGPGEEAGIEPGDVITHVDGTPVTSSAELIVAVRARAPGDTVVLTVRSNGGAARDVEVVLDEAVSD